MNTKIVINSKWIPNKFSLHITDFILMWLLFDRTQAAGWIQGIVYTFLVLTVIGNVVLVFQEKEVDVMLKGM